jgi:hypothetical protein
MYCQGLQQTCPIFFWNSDMDQISVRIMNNDKQWTYTYVELILKFKTHVILDIISMGKKWHKKNATK